MKSVYSLRLPSSLRKKIKTLNPEERSQLNYRLRVEIARSVHNAKFDPGVYLNEEKA